MADASGERVASAALRVLVADDSRRLRRRVRSALEHAGLTVVGEAADGAQTLAQAAALHPDVVLLDPSMPSMDGTEAARKLRLQQPSVQVVLWTKHHDAGRARAAGVLGAGAAVAKGTRTAELIATLRGVCEPQDAGGPHGKAGVDLLSGQGRGRHGARRRSLRALARTWGAWLRPPRTMAAEPHSTELTGAGLATAERAALQQLQAANGYLTRWPVGRGVTRSLADRQLVLVASDLVLLTEAGRRALSGDSQCAAPPDPGQAEHRP